MYSFQVKTKTHEMAVNVPRERIVSMNNGIAQPKRVSGRRSLLGVACLTITLAALPCTAIQAQQSAPAAAPAAPPAAPTGLADTWQGTLHVGDHDLRTVVKISKADDGTYKAVFYSIDQGGMPIAVTKTTLDGVNVKMTIAMISGTFEGKMSPDGKTIEGSWKQGDNPIPLTLARTTPDTAWAIPEPPKQMAADANPGFDVVTIKPSVPGRQGKSFGFRGSHFVTFNTNMNDLVAFAYGLHSKQIVGAPDWFATDLFDIDGVPDVPGQPSLKQMEMMVQKLLPDRFKLTYHHDKKELSVYVISVAPSGPKMAKTSAAPGDQIQGFQFRGLGDLVVRNMNMSEFASWMQSGVMDKPVVDQTGLKDKYDFTLKWTPDDSQFAQFRGAVNITPPKADDPNAPPSLYTAVTETLGLKIAPAKAPDDVIVIDHVEKPSAN